jgi:molybdopterin-containing oxidoreductase family membrane subunit
MVALDFSEALLPGWHSTIFPPFFVAGALFSGFAAVLVLGLPMRRWLGLQDYITDVHVDKTAKILLAAGLVVDYSYGAEIFTAFYSMEPNEIAVIMQRIGGSYAWLFWATIFCNALAIQLLWLPRIRRHEGALFAIAALALIGMWLERLMLIITALYQDFLPSSWGMFYPTLWDFAFLLGSIGLFFLIFLVFVRVLPILSMFEMRKLIDRHPSGVS